MRFKSRSRALAAAALSASVGLAGLTLAASPAQAEPADIVRVAGATRYGTAAAAADRAYPDGATNVVLASGEDFPDALSAGGFAGSLGAPILLTPQDRLDDATLAGLGSLGAETVYVMGGTAAVSDDVVEALEAEGYTVVRVAGDDRFETAAATAAEIGGTTAVLANGFSFADALAISPGAHALELPILLTNANDMPPVTETALEGADTVVIVGGTDVVSQAIEDALEADGKTVVRLAGATRYESAVEIAEFHFDNGFADDELVMATGENFADALAGGPLASQLNAPLVLTQTNVLTPATQTFIESIAPALDTIYILGGTAAITDEVANAAAEAADEGGVSGTVTSTNADPVLFDTADGESLSADLTDGDTDDQFFIDDTAATREVFQLATSPGDALVVIDSDGDGDYDVFRLTNAPAPTSGLVGAVGTDTDDFSIITSAGTSLNVLTYGDADETYTVNGTAVSLAAFEAALSLGDSVTTTDTDSPADGDPDTFALTNGSWDGAVDGIGGVADTSVTFTADGVGDDPDAGLADTEFSVTAAEVGASAQVLTVDGAAATFGEFEAAISAGDTVVYSRTGGVETFALTNVEFDASFSGITDDNTDSATNQVGYISGDTQAVFNYVTAGVTTFVVNGVVSTEAQFETALDGAGSLPFGEAIAYDEDSDTLSLTTATSAGPLPIDDVTAADDGNLTLDTFDVVTADGLIVANDLSAATALDGKPARYFVNGTEVTAAVYEDYLVDIATDTDTEGDSFTVTIGSIATEHRLTTDNTL